MLRATIYEANDWEEAALEQYQRAIELGLRDPKILKRAFQLLYTLGYYRKMNQLLADLSLDTSASVLAPIRRASVAVSLETRDFKQALSLARSTVRPDSTDPAEHVWLGQVYLVSGRDKDAEREFQRAVELAPKQSGPRVALIQFLVSKGRRREAEQAVKDAVSKLNGENTALALGLCYELIGQIAAAEPYYQKALSSDGSRADVIRNVATFYLRNRRPGQAELLLRRLLDQKPPFPESTVRWARRSLAAVIAIRDYPSFLQAIALLDRNLGASQDSLPDLLVKARLLASHSGSKHRQAAALIFEKLASQGKLAARDQQRLARVYDALGRRQTADAYWNTLLKARDSDEGLLAAYVRRQLRHKQLPEAERWWKRLDNISPKSPVTVELHVRLLVEKKQAADAIKLLAAYIRGKTPEVVKQGPDASTRIGRLSQAVVLVSAMCNTEDRTPAEQDLLRRQGEKWFRDLVPRQPQAAPAFAEFLAHQGRVDEALDVLESVTTKLPPLRVTSAGIGVLQTASADATQIQRVEQWLDRVLTKYPGSATDVQYQRAELRVIQQRYDDAIILYRAVLRAKPQHAVSLNNLAWYLSMMKGQHADARTLIDQAFELVGPVAAYLDTRGSIRLNQGDTEGAIQDFTESLVQLDSPQTRFRLAQAYYIAGDRAAATLNLQKAHQAGLDVDQIDPFERKAYLTLVRKLDAAPDR